MKLLCRVLFVCLWVAPLVAQTSMTMPDGTVMPGSAVGAEYYSNEYYTLVDNQGNCATHACLILTNKSTAGTTVSFKQVSSGFDGYTLGLDASGGFWNIPTSHSVAATWSPTASFGTGWKAVSVRTASDIFALYSDPACPAPSYSIKRWDGSWHGLWGCLTAISITNDGVLVGIASDGGIYYTLNPYVLQPTWVGIATGVWSNVVGFNSSVAFGTKGTTLYEINLTNGVVTGVAGAPAVSTAPFSMALTSDEYLFVRSNVAGANGNLYVYNFSSPSATWTNLKGNVALLGGSNRFSLFAQDSAANLFHYLAVALSHTSNVIGRYDCGTTGCPAGSMHTATAMGNFPHGIQTVTSHYVTVTPATQVNVSHVDVSTICDPVFGDPSSPDCFLSGPRTTADVSCNIMGTLFSSAAASTPLLQERIAFTRVIYKGTGGHNCSTDKYGINWCAYDVDNWCSPSTDTPYTLADFTGRSVKDAHFYGYWNTYTACVKVLNTGWTCLDGGGIFNLSVAIGSNAQFPKANCSTK